MDIRSSGKVVVRPLTRCGAVGGGGAFAEGPGAKVWHFKDRRMGVAQAPNQQHCLPCVCALPSNNLYSRDTNFGDETLASATCERPSFFASFALNEFTIVYE